MHSPLPDSSALEAGILEDETPSRLSRVQDNVRNLLRTSRFGSVQSSPPATPRTGGAAGHTSLHNGIPTPPPPETPTRRTQTQPEVLPSPSAESTTSATSSTADDDETPGDVVPSAGFRDTLYRMAHQSALFNTRAIAALDHPDLSHPSLATYVQQKSESQHRCAWARKRDGRTTRYVAANVGGSQGVLCVLAALLLSAIVATYVVLATTSSDVTPTFHILFILGIILATIVFAHTLVRVFLASGRARGGRKMLIIPASRSRHHRHRREHHRDPPPRLMPALPNITTTFVPPTPIQVHMPTDEVRPDSREAQPTATATVEIAPNEWDKDVESVPNPPPAYGRWRGSVRANPDLLHWQAVPSPVDEDTPELASPTYEEAMAAQRTRPPSYVTRASPARQREVREAGTEADEARTRAQSAEPEMVEGRGIGLGV